MSNLSRYLMQLMLTAVVAVPVLCAEPQVQSKIGPKIQFNELTHDFGRIYPYDKHSYVFVFTNVGDSNLVIHKIKTTCHCTASVLSRNVIPPQKKGEMAITLANLGKKSDYINQTVTVFTNDPRNPRVVLRIKAIALHDTILIEPKRLFFGNVADGELKVKQLLVAQIRREKLDITKVESSAEFIGVGIAPNLAKVSNLRKVSYIFGGVKREKKTEATDEKTESVSGSSALATDAPRSAEKERNQQSKRKDQSIEGEDDAPKASYKITVTLDGKKAPLGRFLEFITIYTTSEEFPIHEVIVKGKMVKR